MEKIYRSIILLLIPFLALSFGGVQKWSMMVMELILFILFFIWGLERIIKSSHDDSHHKSGFSFYFFFLPFLLIPFLQLLPLGFNLLEFISPGLFQIKADAAIPDSFGFPSSLSIDRFSTFSSFKILVACLFITFIVSDLFRKKENMKLAIYFITIVSFFISLFGIIQYFSWAGKIFWIKPIKSGAPFGPFVNHNHFASFINMTILPLLALLLYRFSRRNRKRVIANQESIVLIFSLSLALFALLLSGSRGGLISLAVALILLIYILWKEGEYKRKIFFISFVACSLVAFLMFIGSGPLLKTVSSLFNVTDDVSLLYRFKGWKASLDIVKDFPMMGTGLGTYNDAFLLYRPYDMEKTFYYAHNEYLQLLVETGLIGFIFLLIPFMFILIKNNPIKTIINNKETGYLQAGIYSAIVAVLVHNIVEFNMRIPSNAYLFSFLCGLYLANGEKQFYPGKKNYFIFTALSGIFLSFIIMEGVRTSSYLKNKTSMINDKDSTFSVIPLDPDELFMRSKKILKKGEVKESFSFVNEAIKAAPLKAHYWEMLSYLYGLEDNRVESLNALKIASRLDPVSPLYILNVAKKEFEKGNFGSLNKLKELALRRRDQFLPVVTLLIDHNVQMEELLKFVVDSRSAIVIANILSKRGNKEDAGMLFRNAISLAPESRKTLDSYAMYLMMNKDYDSLLKLEQLYKNNLPERVSYWQSRALLQSGDKESAIIFLEKLVSRSSDELKKYGEELAYLYLTIKDYEKAIEIAEEVLKVNERSFRSYQIVSSAYEETGKQLEAINSLRKLAALLPADFNAHYKLHRLYKKAGMLKMSARELESCMEIQPDNMSIRLEMGDLFLLLGREGDAFKQYQTVLSIDPENRAVVGRIEKMNRH